MKRKDGLWEGEEKSLPVTWPDDTCRRVPSRAAGTVPVLLTPPPPLLPPPPPIFPSTSSLPSLFHHHHHHLLPLVLSTSSTLHPPLDHFLFYLFSHSSDVLFCQSFLPLTLLFPPPLCSFCFLRAGLFLFAFSYIFFRPRSFQIPSTPFFLSLSFTLSPFIVCPLFIFSLLSVSRFCFACLFCLPILRTE